jgi:hypothetical protein
MGEQQLRETWNIQLPGTLKSLIDAGLPHFDVHGARTFQADEVYAWMRKHHHKGEMVAEGETGAVETTEPGRVPNQKA